MRNVSDGNVANFKYDVDVFLDGLCPFCTIPCKVTQIFRLFVIKKGQFHHKGKQNLDKPTINF